MKNFKRLLLKLSGEYLGGVQGTGFDFDTIKELSNLVKEVHGKGYEITIVLGGGNFFRGAKSIPIDIDRVAADQIGMMATVMNGICLKESLVAIGLKARVLSGLPCPTAAETFTKPAAMRYLSEGDILIFAGGTGCPYFSTDTAAVLRALEIDADVVIKGTKVDGVYDKDPVVHNDAIKYDALTYSTILEKDLKVMDAAAIALCRENNLPLCVLSIANQNDLLRFLGGDNPGTFIES